MESLPILHEDTTMYGVLVVLAHAGWYSSFRTDRSVGDKERNVGMWIDAPYWKGMPTGSLSRCVGWFSSLEDDAPRESGVRCAGLKQMRPQIIDLWNRHLRMLPAQFVDTVPERDHRGGFHVCQISTPYLKDWLPGGSKHGRSFTPRPVNLPEATPEWLEAHRLNGRAWDHDDPAVALSRFPALLAHLGDEQKLPFQPEWSMASLRFSAMQDYGRRSEETWGWDAKNFVSHFRTPAGLVHMKTGRHDADVSVPANAPGHPAWAIAIRMMAERTISLESDVFSRAPDDYSLFRLDDSGKR